MLWMYLSVFLIATIKFAVAALITMGNPKFNFIEIILTAGGGAIAGSYIFVYFGKRIEKWIRENFTRSKPMSFANRRKIYKIWHRYGLPGVAFLAPFISPMVSIGVAVAFQEKPPQDSDSGFHQHSPLVYCSGIFQGNHSFSGAVN